MKTTTTTTTNHDHYYLSYPRALRSTTATQTTITTMTTSITTTTTTHYYPVVLPHLSWPLPLLPTINPMYCCYYCPPHSCYLDLLLTSAALILEPLVYDVIKASLARAVSIWARTLVRWAPWQPRHHHRTLADGSNGYKGQMRMSLISCMMSVGEAKHCPMYSFLSYMKQMQPMAHYPANGGSGWRNKPTSATRALGETPVSARYGATCHMMAINRVRKDIRAHR